MLASRRTAHRESSSPRRKARSCLCRLHLAAFVGLLCATGATGGDDVPHRRLSTGLFPGPQELNNPLGAYFPEIEQLADTMRLSAMLQEEARRRGLKLGAASPEFFKQQVEALAKSDPELLERLPELARSLGRAPPEATVELASVQRLAEALKDSPYAESLTRFAVKSALRARSARGASAFKSKLRELAGFLERAGVSDAYLDRLESLYDGAKGGLRNALRSMRALTSRAASRAHAVPVPPLLVAVALAVCAAAGILYFLRKKDPEQRTAPPIPDFAALAPTGGDFADALLAFYRRVLFDARVPFTGKVLAELSRQTAARRPELAACLPPLDRAFYEIWYGKEEKSRAELERLSALLADAAAKARIAHVG